MGLAWGVFSNADLRAEDWSVLDRDEDAFRERIRLIEQAREVISIACYNTDSGYVASQLAEALAVRAQEGVQVRLLVDGLPSRRMLDRLHEYRRLGLEVKVFHPLGNRRPDWLNRRLHSKIMLCDDQEMIIGSRNLTDPPFGLACESYIDSDYLIRGELSRCGKQYFDWLWNYSGAICVTHQPHQNTTSLHPSIDVGLFVNHPSDCQFAGGIVSGTVLPHQLALFFDNDYGKRQRSFEDQILQEIENARCEILLETPYPAFSHRLKQALVRAARRNVSVTLFTNSAVSTDQPTTYAALQNQKASLLRAGVMLCEFSGPGTLHAKGIIIDQAVAWVGSYNFDPRGDRLNFELCLKVTDPSFVGAIESSMKFRNSNSQSVGLGDALRLSPETPLGERLKIRGLQLITPLIRRSL